MTITIDTTRHTEPGPGDDNWPDMTMGEPERMQPAEAVQDAGLENNVEPGPDVAADWAAKIRAARLVLNALESIAEAHKCTLAAARKMVRQQKHKLLDLMRDWPPDDSQPASWTQPAESKE